VTEAEFQEKLNKICEEFKELQKRELFIPYYKEYDGLRIVVSKPEDEDDLI
jgi:hypothetical protein